MKDKKGNPDLWVQSPAAAAAQGTSILLELCGREFDLAVTSTQENE